MGMGAVKSLTLPLFITSLNLTGNQLHQEFDNVKVFGLGKMLLGR